MKIGIITFHFVHNQGAVLQCFALKKYLEGKGHEVQVIDYRPHYHTVRYAPWKNPFRYARWYFDYHKQAAFSGKVRAAAKAFLRCMYWNLAGTHRASADAFRAFTEKNLKCTKRYVTLKKLQKDPPRLDAYITGSDQVWNPDLLNHDFDEAYFLHFGDEATHRIAYAVSMGKEPDEDESRKLNALCAGLDAVSLRERTPSACAAIDRQVHICIDPTLLLNGEDYLEVESKAVEQEPYIFVYGLETSEGILAAVKQARELYGCRVINGSPDTVKLSGDGVEIVKDYAPDHFLSLVKHAQCVVTNSFHGTVFSVLYQKQFVTVPHSTRGRRMVELLQKLGLEHALWGAEARTPAQTIDYAPVYEKLAQLRADSMQYLEKALEGCKGEEISPPHRKSQ